MLVAYATAKAQIMSQIREQEAKCAELTSQINNLEASLDLFGENKNERYFYSKVHLNSTIYLMQSAILNMQTI